MELKLFVTELDGTSPQTTSVSVPLAVAIADLTEGTWTLGGNPDKAQPFLGRIEEVRAWARGLTEEEINEGAMRRLVCVEDRDVYIWPMYEGEGEAAREVCGTGDAFQWGGDGQGPVWNRPGAFFCPSDCTSCVPCAVGTSCSLVECTACLPGLPILYDGNCYSSCPQGTEPHPTEDNTCVEAGASPPPPAPKESPPPLPPAQAFPPPEPISPPPPPPDAILPTSMCFDRKLNNGEEDVDCGGPCPRCSAYFDVSLDLQGISIEDFLPQRGLFTLVLTVITRLAADKGEVLMVTLRNVARRKLLEDTIRVRTRLSTWSQDAAFDISEILTEAEESGELAEKLREAGFTLADDGLRLESVQADPRGELFVPPAPPPEPVPPTPEDSAMGFMKIAIPVAGALVGLLVLLLAVWLIIRCIKKRRERGKIGASQSSESDTKTEGLWPEINGGDGTEDNCKDVEALGKDPDSTDAKPLLAPAGNLGAAAIGKDNEIVPAGTGFAGDQNDATRQNMQSTADQLRAMLRQDLDGADSRPGTAPGDPQTLIENHQDQLHAMVKNGLPARPESAAYQPMHAGMPGAMPAAPRTAEEMAAQEVRGIMSEMVQKVEKAEQSRLAELETSFEGSIEALMRSREAKHRQQLADLARIKERFVERTKQIYGDNLAMLDENKLRASQPPSSGASKAQDGGGRGGGGRGARGRGGRGSGGQGRQQPQVPKRRNSDSEARAAQPEAVQHQRPSSAHHGTDNGASEAPVEEENHQNYPVQEPAPRPAAQGWASLPDTPPEVPQPSGRQAVFSALGAPAGRPPPGRPNMGRKPPPPAGPPPPKPPKAPLQEVETEADEVAEYLSPNNNVGRSNGINKLKEQIEDAEAKVSAMEIQLEDAKEQEMMMPGDPDIEAEVMGAQTGLERAQRELAQLHRRLEEQQ